MVGLREIGGIAESANPTPVVERKSPPPDKVATVRDGVKLSRDATELAALVGKIRESEQQDKVHADRVAGIRKALEKGTYRLQEVVLRVAARINRYINTDPKQAAQQPRTP